ncbi:hypothetical protein FNF29_08003 [Cafeteria roenbergensis]|uniref:Cyclic nucleotide-binding domain-containing protein n=1 Tax=Cafeteria roenbergensis TaxID=33653 RepID=A0A5A8C3X3_CAFRO|nr:hypothetical protein FNF29_08003 [Cafeteria roenbergensis]|eukprot:KAA0146531.1 hypothetical protein FNF29_08003 [Cafeteria roenbergensis]
MQARLLSEAAAAVNGSGTPHAPAEGGHGETEPGFHADLSGGILFALVALTIGVLIRSVNKYVPLPYTVLLLVAGALLAILDFYVDLGGLGVSLDTWINIEAHLLFFIFLPALIFGSAFSVDPHIFFRQIGQILILAIPAVGVATVLTAAFGVYAMDIGTWNAGMAFGAMLSATDPVAVVALLKELGAPEQLALGIEGESLFNDGTAAALFLLFAGAMRGEVSSVEEQVAFFFQIALGGSAIGLAVGLLVAAWLVWQRWDPITQVAVTIIAAYTTFIVAEGMMHVSGVLAVVVLGLILAASGRTSIRDHEAMHYFWEMIEFIANTVVFVLAGLLITKRGFLDPLIEWNDWLLLLALYAVLLVVRAVAIAVFWPCLRATGYGLGGREFAVMTWAGLRGAVGLILALQVANNELHGEPQGAIVGHRFLFFMAGITVLTLLVNGTTTGPLVKYLGIGAPTAGKIRMFKRAVAAVERAYAAKRAAMRSDEFFRAVDWNTADGFAAAPDDSSAETDLRDLRQRYIGMVKREYQQALSQGWLSAPAFRVLMEAASSAQDTLDKPMSEWQNVLEELDELSWGAWLQWGFASFCGSADFDRVAHEYELCAGFIQAHLKTRPFLDIIAGGFYKRLLAEEEDAMVAEARVRMEASCQEPAVTRALQTRHAIRVLISKMTQKAELLCEHGEMEAKELEEVVAVLEGAWDAAELCTSIRVDDVSQLREAMFLNQLSEDVIGRLLDARAEVRTLKPGTVLAAQGVKSNTCIVILSGLVNLYEPASPFDEETEATAAAAPDEAAAAAAATPAASASRAPAGPPPRPGDVATPEQLDACSRGRLVDTLSWGSVVGALGMLTGRAAAVTAVARTAVRAVVLRQRDVFPLIKSAQGPVGVPFRAVAPLEEALCRMAALLECEVEMPPRFRGIPTQELRALLARAQLVRPSPFRPVRLSDTVMMVTGALLAPTAEARDKAQRVLAHLRGRPEGSLFGPVGSSMAPQSVANSTAAAAAARRAGANLFPIPVSTRNHHIVYGSTGSDGPRTGTPHNGAFFGSDCELHRADAQSGAGKTAAVASGTPRGRPRGLSSPGPAPLAAAACAAAELRPNGAADGTTGGDAAGRDDEGDDHGLGNDDDDDDDGIADVTVARAHSDGDIGAALRASDPDAAGRAARAPRRRRDSGESGDSSDSDSGGGSTIGDDDEDAVCVELGEMDDALASRRPAGQAAPSSVAVGGVVVSVDGPGGPMLVPAELAPQGGGQAEPGAATQPAAAGSSGLAAAGSPKSPGGSSTGSKGFELLLPIRLEAPLRPPCRAWLEEAAASPRAEADAVPGASAEGAAGGGGSAAGDGIELSASPQPGQSLSAQLSDGGAFRVKGHASGQAFDAEYAAKKDATRHLPAQYVTDTGERIALQMSDFTVVQAAAGGHVAGEALPRLASTGSLDKGGSCAVVLPDDSSAFRWFAPGTRLLVIPRELVKAATRRAAKHAHAIRQEERAAQRLDAHFEKQLKRRKAMPRDSAAKMRGFAKAVGRMAVASRSKRRLGGEGEAGQQMRRRQHSATHGGMG